MKLNYYPETDSLYIDLSEKASVNSQEIAEGVVLDFDEEGHLSGIDIEQASKRVNLNSIETMEIPVTTLIMKKAG